MVARCTAPRRKLHARDAGFTLIEIVVSLAILGAALVILLENQYSSLRLYDDAQHEVEMDRFLRLAAGIAETEVLAGNRSGGEPFSRRYKDYSYKFTATEMDATRVPGLFEVEVRVNGPENDSREVVVLVFNPAQPE